MGDKSITRILNDRLTKLEVTVAERWDAHDKRSEDMWGYIKDKLDTLCSLQDKCRKEWKEYIHRIIGYTIAIPTIIFSIWKLFEALK